MHAASAAEVNTSAYLKSHLLAITEKFQQDVISWLSQIQFDSFIKSVIFDFLSKNDAAKLKKNDDRLALGCLPFSILRMKKHDDSIVFRLIGHDRIGKGAYGEVKIAFPLLFFGKSFMVQTHLPIALKIIRTESMNEPNYPVPSACSLEHLAKIYPDSFAFVDRPTTSLKNPELNCDNKKYISTPLFDALDLANFFEKYYKILDDVKIINILLNVLDAIEKLHRDELVHRDIKFENILIYPETHTIELIDYDACEKIGVETRMAGTKIYMRGNIKSKYLETVSIDRDLYAFSCMLKEIKNTNIYPLLNVFFGELVCKIAIGDLVNINAIKDELKRKCPAAQYLPHNYCAFGLEEKSMLIHLNPEAENTPPRTKRKAADVQPPTPQKLNFR